MKTDRLIGILSILLLADAFDCIGPDDKFGQQTWEAAESSLQKEALTLALGKADQKPEDMQMCIRDRL